MPKDEERLGLESRRKEEVVDKLIQMMQAQEVVASKSNVELAEALIALTENLTVYSLHYQVLMESALRLAPEVFD